MFKDEREARDIAWEQASDCIHRKNADKLR